MLVRLGRSMRALVYKSMICDIYDRLRIKTIESDRNSAAIVRVGIEVEPSCAMSGSMAAQPSSSCGSFSLRGVSVDVVG